MSYNEWKKCKLEDLGTLARGKSKYRPRDAAFLYGGKYPFIQTGDIKSANRKITRHSQTYSEEGLKQSKLWDKGTICITIAANIAETAILSYPACFPDSVIGFVADQSKCDIDFMEYLLRYIKKDIQNHAVGSVQENINLGTFQNIDILVPNLAIQQKISFILSSIDEKIENNLATNQTLEEIARTIFKEWFVNFNYPNADGSRKHSEFGEIPTDWEVGTLGDIYKTTSGGTPSRSKMEYYENGTIGWIKSKELKNTFILDTEEKITETALKNSSAKLLANHSVLIAMYGATVGEIGITANDFTCNQAICAFLPNENYPYSFIYHFLLQCKQDIIGQAVGSAQQNISQQLLLQYKLAIPPCELVKEFHKIVEPLFEKIKDNLEENVTLIELRDSLLPKLMSGEIDVSNVK